MATARREKRQLKIVDHTATEPLTRGERRRFGKLERDFQQAEQHYLYARVRIIWEIKERKLHREHDSFEAYTRDVLDLDDREASELVRIHVAVQKLAEISAAGPLPSRAYHWRPIVTDVPTTDDAYVVAAVLDRADVLRSDVCEAYAQRLLSAGARINMGAKGTPLENAQAERFFRT
jgi:hypothetical protein